jgi:hypothetical protein
VFVLPAPEGHLLHYIGKDRRVRVELRIDLEKLSQWRELNLFNVACAIATQFPIVSQSEMNGGLHDLVLSWSFWFIDL